jgi:hypothetical protein
MEQEPRQPWHAARAGAPSPGYAPPYAHPLPYQGGWGDPYQSMRDADHLKTLSICHYVWGGVSAVFSMCGLVYVFMGLAFVNDPSSFNGTQSGSGSATGGPPPPESVGYLFVGMGTAVIFFGCLIGGLTIYSGRCIARHKNRTFSLIMAGVNCLSVPVGTTLGVFTFVVLLRDSVRALYASAAPGQPVQASRSPYG